MAGAGATGAGATAGGGTATGSGTGGSLGTAGIATGLPGVPDVDLATLSDHVGRVVRIGGLVAELAPDGFLLDDGTATGRVVLAADAAVYLPLVEPGDALNATGRVERSGDELRIVVDTGDGLVLVGDPTAPDPQPAVAEPAAKPGDAAQGVSRLAGGLLGPVEPGAAGLVSVALLSALSLAVTMLRRRRARRLLAARVGSRLAAISGPPGPAPSGTPAPPPPG
jgi:hypothetical protein